MKPVKKIAVTGAAGQIAYSLLFRIASGELLGADQPISLHLLEVPQAMSALEGVVMELEDCAFPALQQILTTDDPYEAFSEADFVFLVGAKPRSPGMERKDLLLENAKIFQQQGRALGAAASRQVKVLVVGNPCNTNCLIALNEANQLGLGRDNFYAMMQLDANRAQSQLARKSGLCAGQVQGVVIWGNHSSTQVPDASYAHLNGREAACVLDKPWLFDAWITSIQKRGAQVLEKRGKSSAASAASAAMDAMRALITPSIPGQWHVTAVLSDGNPYGISEGVIFSFPCRTTQDGLVEIVPHMPWPKELDKPVRMTEQELLEEKAALEILV